MCEHNLCYLDDLEKSKGKKSKDCITRIVTKRKIEMVSKLIISSLTFLQQYLNCVCLLQENTFS